jgi:hypothetical protein
VGGLSGDIDASTWGVLSGGDELSVTVLGEFGEQVGHVAVALDTVTVPAEQLEIVQVMGAALAAGHEVVYFEVAELEV